MPRIFALRERMPLIVFLFLALVLLVAPRCFVHNGHAPIADRPLERADVVTRLKRH